MQTSKAICISCAIISILSGCNSIRPINDGGPSQDIDVTSIANATPKPESKSNYGNMPSYNVNGHTYHVLPKADGYSKTGIASWYGTKFHGQLTSSREIYNMFDMTAASTELPLPTYVKVTNLENGRQIIVKVNDRGPFDKDRLIDLSYTGAKKLGYIDKGTALVKVTAIEPRQWSYPKNAAPPQAKTNTKSITHTPQIYLQLGAFSDVVNAQKLQQQLTYFIREKTLVQKGQKASDSVYRVQIGPLESVAQNDRLQQLLTKHGLGRAMTIVQ